MLCGRKERHLLPRSTKRSFSTLCALLPHERRRECLAETLTEWRSLSARRHASSLPSTDGAAIHVRLAGPCKTAITET